MPKPSPESDNCASLLKDEADANHMVRHVRGRCRAGRAKSRHIEHEQKGAAPSPDRTDYVRPSNCKGPRSVINGATTCCATVRRKRTTKAEASSTSATESCKHGKERGGLSGALRTPETSCLSTKSLLAAVARSPALAITRPTLLPKELIQLNERNSEQTTNNAIDIRWWWWVVVVCVEGGRGNRRGREEWCGVVLCEGSAQWAIGATRCDGKCANTV